MIVSDIETMMPNDELTERLRSHRTAVRRVAENLGPFFAFLIVDWMEALSSSQKGPSMTDDGRDINRLSARIARQLVASQVAAP